MSCDNCRHDGTPVCATCEGEDLFQPLPTEDEQRQIAKAVQQRAEKLLSDVPPEEEKSPADDPRFIRRCLDANERGDGVLFATMNRGKFLYNVSVKDAKRETPWYRWAGHVWRRDDFSEAMDAVEQVALRYQQQADILADQIREQGDKPQKHLITLRRKYQSRADRLRSENGAGKALRWAPIVDRTLAAREGDFNQRPWLLPSANGVINLQTGVLEAGRPEDLLTRAIDVPYDPHADMQPWIDVVQEICDSPDVAAFLQRTFGYAATGFSHEQYIWVFVGPGRNGKGLLFDLIGDVLGPYYHEISRAMLIQQRNEPGPNAASEHKYSLLGKRVIVGAETNKGQRIDAAAIKSLTGEDRINCRPNFKSEIVFKPTHTLFLHTNHLPEGLTKDFALRQRLLKIDFPWMYVDDPAAEAAKEPAKADRFRKKDPHIKDRLRQCKPGILRWIVEGCLQWQQMGLAPPDIITRGVEELAKEEDYLGQFLDDCIEMRPDHPHCRISSTDLYDTFRWWWAHNMDSQERRVPGIRSVTSQLRDRGLTVDKIGGKVWLLNAIIDDDIFDEVRAWKR